MWPTRLKRGSQSGAREQPAAIPRAAGAAKKEVARSFVYHYDEIRMLAG